MTQFYLVRPLRFLLFAVCLLPSEAISQLSSVEDDFRVYTEHPRLFLRPQRLRLLKRERERQSIRWQQFDLLVSGKAQMPEPGFALGLYSVTSGDKSAGQQAVEWALNPARTAGDLRQLALVLDWCQPFLDAGKTSSLAAKLQQFLVKTEGARDTPTVRSRVLAAVALAGHETTPGVSENILKSIVEKWWRGEIAPAIKSGKNPIVRDDLYALLEVMHPIRDNLNIELRDSAPGYFKDLPAEHLLSHYPASYPAAENEYRIPIYAGTSEPDLRKAAQSRAAELSMVAYDANALAHQYLQGWLIQDRFLMRGVYGISYEFLWANPYQPGLTYHKMPLFRHNTALGRLFVRSSWDEDATWFGAFDGQMQYFEDGKVKVLNPRTVRNPIQVGDATILPAKIPLRFNLGKDAFEEVFVVGLKPRQKYDVEVDDEEMYESRTDAAGILSLTFAAEAKAGVRIKEAPK